MSAQGLPEVLQVEEAHQVQEAQPGGVRCPGQVLRRGAGHVLRGLSREHELVHERARHQGLAQLRLAQDDPRDGREVRSQDRSHVARWQKIRTPNSNLFLVLKRSL